MKIVSFVLQPMMRRSTENGSGGGGSGNGGSGQGLMSKLHQCEIHMKFRAGGRKRQNFLQAWLNKFPSRAKKIDVISRIIFPAIFAMFNLSYWCYYLLQEGKGVIPGTT